MAHYQPQDDLLTVWDSTQHPHEVRDQIATLLHRPEHSACVAPDVGGGFGEKGGMYSEELVIPYLAMRLGRPVKWVEERWENMLAFHGRGHTVDVEAAAQRDGTLLGLRVQMWQTWGRIFSSLRPPCPSSPAIVSPGPTPRPCMWRSVGSSPINRPPGRTGGRRPGRRLLSGAHHRPDRQRPATESSRRAAENFIPPDAFPYETPTGLTYDSGQYEPTLDRALELSAYHHWRAQARQPGLLEHRALASAWPRLSSSGGRVAP